MACYAVTEIDANARNVWEDTPGSVEEHQNYAVWIY